MPSVGSGNVFGPQSGLSRELWPICVGTPAVVRERLRVPRRLRVPSSTAANKGLSVGKLAARIPKHSSSMYQIWKLFSKAESGVSIAVTCKCAFTMPAAQAMKPRERTAMRVSLVRLLTWSFSMTGIGRMAKTMSVMMFTTEFQRPMKLYVWLEKQRVSGEMRTRKLQPAVIGVHWKNRVPEQANAKQRRNPAVVSFVSFANMIEQSYQRSSTRRSSSFFVP